MLWLLSFCCRSRSRREGFCPAFSFFFFRFGGARQSATSKWMCSKCGPAMIVLPKKQRLEVSQEGQQRGEGEGHPTRSATLPRRARRIEGVCTWDGQGHGRVRVLQEFTTSERRQRRVLSHRFEIRQVINDGTIRGVGGQNVREVHGHELTPRHTASSGRPTEQKCAMGRVRGWRASSVL